MRPTHRRDDEVRSERLDVAARTMPLLQPQQPLRPLQHCDQEESLSNDEPLYKKIKSEIGKSWYILYMELKLISTYNLNYFDQQNRKDGIIMYHCIFVKSLT